MDERDDYVLGRNVTKQALGQEGLTSVISIRLSPEEMDAVNIVAEREGKTFTQVVREAIRQMNSARETGLSGVMPFFGGVSIRSVDPGTVQSIRNYETPVALTMMQVEPEEHGVALSDSPGA